MSVLQRHGYRHARRAYQAVGNRAYLKRRRELVDSFAPFIGRGDLVFDIGAHKGEYTDIFLGLGARVVAVEPNPVLAGALRRRYPVVVEQAAVGAERGRLPLHLGKDLNHSTLANEWVERTDPSRWLGAAVEVEVLTVDALVERHGVPSFLKIDVEGFEDGVLEGCSALPRGLCFEYQTSLIGVAERCVHLLGDAYEFLTVDGGWLDRDAALRWLASRSSIPMVSGDLFARRVG